MKAALSRPSDGQFEVGGGEVQSKAYTEAGSRCSSWTDERHMLYLNSLEESFVNQLHGSQFHFHFMNLLGGSRTNQRQSDSSITSESLSVASQLKRPQKGCREDLKLVESKSGIKKENSSFSLSENQWIRHFAPNFSQKGVNIKANCQVVDRQPSYSSKPVKKELGCYSNESTSRAQPSASSSGECDEHGEVSDQNFNNEDIAGPELTQTYKKRRLSSPVPPPLVDLVRNGSVCVLEKQKHELLKTGIN